MAKNEITNNASTKSRWLKIAVFILLLALYASFLIHRIELPAADDMARHVKSGELILKGNFDVLRANVFSYTEPAHPFTNHHWLSGAIFYLLHQAVGWPGLVIFKVIVLLFAFSVLFATALKKADFWLVAFFSIPVILILGMRSTLRPEIFSYLFIAIFLYLLVDWDEHPEKNKIFWLIPLQLLWVNMHIFFIIGPLLAGGFLLEKIILSRFKLRGDYPTKKLGLLVIALLAVCLINPNGIRGALYPFQIFENYGIDVSENRSASRFLREESPLTSIPVVIFQALVWLLAASFILSLKSKRILYFLASAATATVGFMIYRTLSLFSLIFLPAVSANLNNIFSDTRKKMSRVSRTVLLIFFLGLLGWFIITGVRGKIFPYNAPGFGLTAGANDSAKFFKQHGLKGPIFNDYDIGSYLVHHLYPQEKVFVDNRPEAYSASFLTDIYGAMLQYEDHWKAALEKYQFNAVFLYQYSKNSSIRPLIYRRFIDPAWALVYVDRYAVIFLKNNPRNQTVIDEFRITLENIEQRIGHLLQSPKLEDQMAAADIFSLVHREDRALEIFKKVVEKWPEKGRVWKVMGELALYYINRPDPVLAVSFLERAIAAGEKTPETYRLLGAAYYRTGNIEKAKETLKKGLRTNEKNN